MARSIASGHRRDPLTNLVMPTVVQIDSPQAQLSLRIDLGNVEINRLSDDRPALWSMPSIPGTPLVDMGDPNFHFPEPQPATAAARPAFRRRQPPASDAVATAEHLNC